VRSASALLAFSFALAVPASAAAQRREQYFYHGYDYGTESLQSPLYAIVNRGFDAIQLRKDRTPVVKIVDTRNVVDNLFDPKGSIEPYGFGTWVKTEVLPLDWTKTGARWVPNYGLHLLGGGQTYAWMREWFLARDAPEALATIGSAASLMVGALINESIENKGVVGPNSDAFADIWVFDLGGILLFSFEGARKFFSKTVTISDWSLQPAIMYPKGTLHNVGNYYSLKIPIPFVPRVKFFAYGGYATMGGLSVKLDREYSLSVAGGARISAFENPSGTLRVDNVIETSPSAGAFLDRNESLLAFVQVSDIDDYTFTANMYPNAFVHSVPGLGSWTAIGRDGRWVAGVSFTHSIGIGFGLGTR
jgi:hypothetical protein